MASVGPRIVTDGLVMYLDESDPNSYVRHSDVNMSTWDGRFR